jgi:hypothetical protein
MTIRSVHNSRKARNAQSPIHRAFLPNGGTVTDVEVLWRKAGASAGPLIVTKYASAVKCHDERE